MNNRGLHVFHMDEQRIDLLVADATRGCVLPSGHLLYTRVMPRESESRGTDA